MNILRLLEKAYRNLSKAKYFATRSKNEPLVHSGFQDRYEIYRNRILEELKNLAFDDILITGHSLGGALATLCYMEISQQSRKKVSMSDFITKVSIIFTFA